MQCLLAAYGTERTMVLQANWSDRNFTWTDAFMPVFEEYTLDENDSWSYWPGKIVFVELGRANCTSQRTVGTLHFHPAYTKLHIRKK